MMRAVCVALSGLAGIACNGILGIEEAEGDVNIGKDGGGLDSGATPAPADAGADANQLPLCERYCRLIEVNCTGANNQYISPAVCRAMCPKFEPGREGDTNGNSVGCRLSHAGLAKDDPITHCPHAGPLGAGTCGESCASYALLNFAHCRDATKPPYPTEEACRTTCSNGINTTFKYTPNVDVLTTQSGNTMNCRLYHLQAAYEVGFKNEHCPHTAVPSDTCK
jgi:hypothetical protein